MSKRPAPPPEPVKRPPTVSFGVQQLRTQPGWVPCRFELEADRVLKVQPLSEPMPYQALAYEYLAEAVRAHYLELSRV